MPPRPMRGVCSPVKDDENAEEKLIKGTIKKNNLRLLNIYEQWKKHVKIWIKNAEKSQTGDSSVGKKGGALSALSGYNLSSTVDTHEYQPRVSTHMLNS